MLKRIFRRTHRWIGLLLAVQVIAWMASGLYFSLFPIEHIRGEHLTRKPSDLARADWASAGSPEELARLLDAYFSEPWALQGARLHHDGQGIVWRVNGWVEGVAFVRLVDVRQQVVRQPMDRAKAAERAQSWLLDPGPVESVDWIAAGSGETEFRGQNRPAWRVRFQAPERINVYLDPWTGELLARRTDRWSLFDFLWMLHIMDFQTRDDFNHPLLQIAAFLGLVIAISGLILWLLTTRLFRRRPGHAPSGHRTPAR